MDNIMIVGLSVLGLVLGSFAGAQVWRLRARQLAEDKDADEPYDKAEYKKLRPLMGRKQLHDRSACLRCGAQLQWYDMIPLVSWLSLGGKCRYCQAPIGRFEPVMELITAGLFVLSFLLWPFGFSSVGHAVLFTVWLAIIVVLMILAAYDYKWQLLPDVVNYTFIALSVVFLVGLYILQVTPLHVGSILGSVGFLGGLYAVLYVISKGSWIGFGDVKLGVGLGLILADWKLAFLALFLANLLGCLVVLPGIMSHTMSTKSRIPFGPLLIVGTLIAFWWGRDMINWLLLQSFLFI